MPCVAIHARTPTPWRCRHPFSLVMMLSIPSATILLTILHSSAGSGSGRGVPDRRGPGARRLAVQRISGRIQDGLEHRRDRPGCRRQARGRTDRLSNTGVHVSCLLRRPRHLFVPNIPWFGVGGEWTHNKAIAEVDQLVGINGAGPVPLSVLLSRLEMTNGLNFALANLVVRRRCGSDTPRSHNPPHGSGNEVWNGYAMAGAPSKSRIERPPRPMHAASQSSALKSPSLLPA